MEAWGSSARHSGAGPKPSELPPSSPKRTFAQPKPTASWNSSANADAYTISFFGTQPRMTQVPPAPARPSVDSTLKGHSAVSLGAIQLLCGGLLTGLPDPPKEPPTCCGWWLRHSLLQQPLGADMSPGLALLQQPLGADMSPGLALLRVPCQPAYPCSHQQLARPPATCPAAGHRLNRGCWAATPIHGCRAVTPAMAPPGHACLAQTGQRVAHLPQSPRAPAHMAAPQQPPLRARQHEAAQAAWRPRLASPAAVEDSTAQVQHAQKRHDTSSPALCTSTTAMDSSTR